jgi:hypothetical protein
MQSLQGLGWIEGANVRIDYRWGGTDPERVRSVAVELVKQVARMSVAKSGTLAVMVKYLSLRAGGQDPDVASLIRATCWTSHAADAFRYLALTLDRKATLRLLSPHRLSAARRCVIAQSGDTIARIAVSAREQGRRLSSPLPLWKRAQRVATHEWVRGFETNHLRRSGLTSCVVASREGTGKSRCAARARTHKLPSRVRFRANRTSSRRSPNERI